MKSFCMKNVELGILKMKDMICKMLWISFLENSSMIFFHFPMTIDHQMYRLPLYLKIVTVNYNGQLQEEQSVQN